MLTKTPYRCPGDDSVIHQACSGLLSQWTGPVDEHVTRTSLGETHLIGVGPAAGRPIVVLAGGDLPAAGLRELAGSFDTSTRVTLVDLPGLPGSSACERPDSNVHAAYGRWLTEILDALQLERTPVLGLGWAASAAAAISDVDRVGKLVLAAPLGLVPRARWHRGVIAGLQWRNEPSIENTERYLRSLAGEGFEPDDSTVRWSCRMGAYCRSQSGMPRISGALWKRWRGRDVEIVVGEQDPLVQVSALRRMGAEIDAHVAVVPGVGHLIAVEAPTAVARAGLAPSH
ncbi:MAG: alpha/beta hydrolase [Rhodococcus sp.]|uniref:alpha/beta fold hydrolase n=1 Tax=Rhodococcus TaxID=1827 RepID=UPI0016A98E26|nr:MULTISPECIES: alpha/beta hydrolase [Rhodococcus]NLV80721.1 alpha/beta hydrolase [Rhodococcus sp. (in: high G+C Gram-positive bacteria)]